MKKVLLVLGIVIGALGLAGLVFWVGWLRAPDGAAVCENVVKVMSEEKDLKDAVKEKAKKDCEARAQPPKYGRLNWVKQMKCMRDAASKSELDACTKRST